MKRENDAKMRRNDAGRRGIHILQRWDGRFIMKDTDSSEKDKDHE